MSPITKNHRVINPHKYTLHTECQAGERTDNLPVSGWTKYHQTPREREKEKKNVVFDKSFFPFQFKLCVLIIVILILYLAAECPVSHIYIIPSTIQVSITESTLVSQRLLCCKSYFSCKKSKSPFTSQWKTYCFFTLLTTCLKDKQTN